MNGSNIFVGVATHKEYEMPNDSMYFPIHVGAYNKKALNNYLSDAMGDNISKLNSNYCELTAIYYIWKNIDKDYKGLAHYRRHFTSQKYHSDFTTGSFSKVLDGETLQKHFKQYDAILPTKRKYFIETLYSHYKHTHEIYPLDKTREIIKEICPEYIACFDKVMKRRSAHMFNMFIMKAEYFDLYSEWLFSILFELQENIDISEYDEQEKRVFGFVSELLLDVWLEKNDIKFKELPVMFMEYQNWWKKGSKFLMHKFVSKYS